MTIHVPGSFELPSGARMLAETGNFDALILLGCVIRGETSHYDYFCQGVTQGTMALNLSYSIPFVFGVLTTENKQQSMDRAGGKYGNKGEEAAVTAIKMATLLKKA
jgi:6,7-dimethyl-8-ribityllumazine synthase